MGTTLSSSDSPRPADPAPSDPPLPDDPILLQGMIRELLAALQAERHQREHLEQRLDQLLRRLYGPRSEKIVGPTLFDAFTPPAAESPPSPNPESVPEPSPAAQTKRGHGRRRLPEDLPRRRIVHDLTEAEKLCPCCQSPRVLIGEDVSSRLDYVPASLYVAEHARPKYACRKLAGQVAQAELPPEPIEKGIPAAGLLAEIIVSKFVDHQPLHRQQQKFQRQGVDIHRSTMGDWLGQRQLAGADLCVDGHCRLAVEGDSHRRHAGASVGRRRRANADRTLMGILGR